MIKEIRENKENVKEIIMDCLDRLRFLYKSQDYAYEKELRLVIYKDYKKAKVDITNNEKFLSRLYIDIDKEINYSEMEVILAPKVENSTNISNYLYHTGIKKVRKSKIKYI